MNYPNGMKRPAMTAQTSNTYSNRGMTLEEDINLTNKFYLESNIAVIHKKPTPIQVVQVHYPKRSAAVITEGYFQKPSTTDYNGLYQGKYIDFEVKETKNKTSFPLANFHEHQIKHMQSVAHHGGVCFMIIRFTAHDETYLLEVKHLLTYWNNQFKGKRKSIPYSFIQENGYLIPFKYKARVDYLEIVDKLYF